MLPRAMKIQNMCPWGRGRKGFYMSITLTFSSFKKIIKCQEWKVCLPGNMGSWREESLSLHSLPPLSLFSNDEYFTESISCLFLPLPHQRTAPQRRWHLRLCGSVQHVPSPLEETKIPGPGTLHHPPLERASCLGEEPSPALGSLHPQCGPPCTCWTQLHPHPEQSGGATRGPAPCSGWSSAPVAVAAAAAAGESCSEAKCFPEGLSGTHQNSGLGRSQWLGRRWGTGHWPPRRRRSLSSTCPARRRSEASCHTASGPCALQAKEANNTKSDTLPRPGWLILLACVPEHGNVLHRVGESTFRARRAKRKHSSGQLAGDLDTHNWLQELVAFHSCAPKGQKELGFGNSLLRLDSLDSSTNRDDSSRSDWGYRTKQSRAKESNQSRKGVS